MTETHFTWRWLFVTGAIGVIGGLLLGLIIGWFTGPAPSATVDVTALSASGQNDYIVMVANAFAYDNDLPRAKERLLQLKDPQVNTRVERLAKALAARKDPSAAYVADLAVALGSSDSALSVLAASISNTQSSGNVPPGPTKFAAPEATETEIPSPTVATETPTEVPTGTPTIVPTKISQLQLPTRTPRAIATAAPTQPLPMAPLSPAWLPDFPSMWWPGIQFTPATVASGQQYWHLKSALYCDVLDKRNNCQSLPGGENDHTIYLSLLNPDGSCASATVKHLTNTGDTTPLEEKPVIYPWNSCDKTDFEWNMYGEGSDVWIDGLPSDRIGGMCLCNVLIAPEIGHNVLQGHAHVRYFLIFQLTAR